MAGKLSGNSGKLSKRGGIRALRGCYASFFSGCGRPRTRKRMAIETESWENTGEIEGENTTSAGKYWAGQRGCGGVIAHSAADGHGKASAVGQTEQPPGEIAQAEADDSHEDGGQHQKQQGAVQMVQLIGAAGDVGAHDQQQHQLGGQRPAGA